MLSQRPSTQAVIQASEYKIPLIIRCICHLFYMLTGKSFRSVFPAKPCTQQTGVSEIDLARIHRRLKQSRGQ